MDTQYHEIRAGIGFFNRTVACRISEDGFEIARDGDVTRIGYDAIAKIRFYRHASGRSFLKLEIVAGTVATLKLTPKSTAGRGIDGFVQSLLQRVASSSPATQVVFGPSRTQWTASWIGALVSGAVILFASWSLLAGGQIGPVLMPVGIALVNLVIVVPILRSGQPRHYTAADAPAALG